jgi:hypothetical protein
VGGFFLRTIISRHEKERSYSCSPIPTIKLENQLRKLSNSHLTVSMHQSSRNNSQQNSRRNSTVMKMDSQEQVNQLTRFLFLNESSELLKDSSASSHSSSRRGSYGVHFNEKVQIRLFRKKSECIPQRMV